MLNSTLGVVATTLSRLFGAIERDGSYVILAFSAYLVVTGAREIARKSGPGSKGRGRAEPRAKTRTIVLICVLIGVAIGGAGLALFYKRDPHAPLSVYLIMAGVVGLITLFMCLLVIASAAIGKRL